MVDDVSMTEAPLQMQEEIIAVMAPDEPEADVLARARLAAESGVLIEPAGANALYFYSLYLESQPDDQQAQDEANSILERVSEMIESESDSGNFEKAAALVGQIRNTGFTHPIVEAFPARIAVVVEETKAAAMRAATRGDSNASNAALQAFEALPTVTTGDLLTLRSEVRDAIDARRLSVAAAAAARRARQQQARQQAAATASQSQNTPRIPQAAVAKVVAEADLDSVRAAIEQAVNAGNYSSAVNQFAAVPASVEGYADLQSFASELLQNAVRGSADRQALPNAEAALAAWRAVTSSSADEASLQAVIDRAYIEIATSETVSAGTMRRLVTVAPVYPRAGIRRGLSSRLRVEFTVNIDGNTEDINVIESANSNVFERSAVRAVSGWRYEPRVVRNQKVPQRVYAFVDYNLE